MRGRVLAWLIVALMAGVVHVFCTITDILFYVIWGGLMTAFYPFYWAQIYICDGEYVTYREFIKDATDV